jgi:hypothetical protein
MALAFGDPVLLASVFTTPALSDPARVADGSAVQLPFGNGASQYLMNAGTLADGDTALLREVAPGSSGLFGSCVQMSGKSTQFRGAVIAELQVELDTTGGTGSLTECVLVQGAAGFRFLAKASDVEEVPC